MISLSRNRALLTGLCLAALCGVARAQGGALGADFSVPPTPSPVGSGARASGMANAFVAIADDATAASWNPAGLVQLERPEISFVGSFLNTRDDFSSDLHPELDDDSVYDTTDLNYLSFVYPLPLTVWERNVVLSLNYQRKYEFTRAFGLDINTRTVVPPPINTLIRQFGRLEFEQEGSLSAVTPALAFELTNTLSLGVAFNWWTSTPFSDNGWEQTTRFDTRTFIGMGRAIGRGYSHEEYEDFEGENFTLGALWNVTDRWSLGLRYDTAFTGEAGYTSIDRSFRLNLANPLAGPVVNLTTSRETRKIHFPDTFAIGAAYRANDRLTLSLDVSRTDWNDGWVKDSRGRKFAMVDGTDLSDPRTRTHLDPAYTVRLGAEYTFIPREPGLEFNQLWTLRGGLFYEEEPATGRSTRFAMSRGNGEPDRFYGFAVGVGVLAFQRVNIDLAYELRYGPSVNRDVLRGVEGLDTDELRQRILLSTVIYF